MWAHTEKVSYGDDDSEEQLSQTTIVTIYPGGLVVTQLYHPEGDNIAIGDLNREKTAVFNSINTGVGMTGDDVAPDSPLRIWTMTDFDPPCLMWEIGDKNRSSFTMNGEKFDYIDISGVSPARWKELVAELKKRKTSARYANIPPSPKLSSPATTSQSSSASNNSLLQRRLTPPHPTRNCVFHRF